LGEVSGRAVKPSTINIALLAAIAACLALLFAWVYTVVKEEYAWHQGSVGLSRPVIADITVNLGGAAIRELCQTCHSGGRRAEPMKHGAPSTSHPDITPHSIYELGCTACHLGEGMAADLKISHGRVGDEERKVLSGEAIQSTCYRCHELRPLKGAEKAWKGSRLFSENACGLCHSIGEAKGAAYGPDLTDAGSFLSLEQIQTVVENPKKVLEGSIMPKFSLPPEEIRCISYFLKSRIKNPYYEAPMTRMAGREAPEPREKSFPRERAPSREGLLKEKKCLACHKFGEADGLMAPDLTYTAYMRPKDYIMNFLKTPGKEVPGAIMPISPATADEERAIVSLLTRKRPIHLPGGNAGMNIYMRLCQRCHAADGDGFGTIQPNLANFPRPFRDNKAFFASIPDTRIVKSIEKGVPGTSMPPYGQMFDHPTIDSLIDLLFRGFIRSERKDKKLPVPPAKPVQLPKIEEMRSTFKRKCALCHGAYGTGTGPDYLKYLPRPRDLTNSPYFNGLTDERIAVAIAAGVPGTAMPAFAGAIPDATIWGLVGTVRAFSQTKERYNDGR
jgi:cytochrome c2